MVKQVQLLTHYLIACVSLLKLIIDEKADKIQLPAMNYTSMSLRYMDFDNEGPAKKLHNAVHISPYEKPKFMFSLNNLYRTSCLNIPAADCF